MIPISATAFAAWASCTLLKWQRSQQDYYSACFDAVARTRWWSYGCCSTRCQALLTEPGHAIRSVVGAPLFALLSGCGLKVIIETFTARRRAVAIDTAALVIAGALGLYGKRCFVDYAEYGATEWMHGVRAAFVEVETHPHTQLYLSDEIFLSHIFALFYTAYPPAQYQRDPLRSVHQGRWNYRRYRFGNNEINNVAKIMQRPCSNSALIAIAGEGRPYVSTSRWQRVRTITVPDGRAALDVFICPE